MHIFPCPTCTLGIIRCGFLPIPNGATARCEPLDPEEPPPGVCQRLHVWDASVERWFVVPPD